MDKNLYSIDEKYSIKEIGNFDKLEEFRPIWNSLAEKQGPYKIFLSYDWFKIWLKHFLGENKLVILLLYKENEIVAIAPFSIKRERFKGVPIKKIELLGNVYSPFRYFLINEGDDKEKVKNLFCIFDFVFKQHKGWSVLDLHAIPQENNWFNLVITTLKRMGLNYSDYLCFGDWYLDEIKYSGEEYFNNLPQKIKKDILYCKRRLEKMGKCEFKLIRNGNNIDDYMDLYYKVYEKSWQKKEGVGPNFHRDLAKIAIRNNWLRLGFLFFDNSPIASQFWVSNNEIAYILKTVYNQEYKKFSPGKILTSEMMKYVIDMDGVNIVDYVQGDEAYKEDWTPKRRERCGVLIFNNNIKGKYLELLTRDILPTVEKNKYLRKAKQIVKRFL
ncbi:MAG: GNAT family N-acetyltransferase [Thermodesulfobacteriota bacterium]|jgi:CelD/BcsL family acetyltransferase involved in cellulose biosynthesis